MSQSWLSPCILLKSSDIWPQLWQARPSTSTEPETHIIIYICLLLYNMKLFYLSDSNVFITTEMDRKIII